MSSGESFAAQHASEFALLKRSRARRFFKGLGILTLASIVAAVLISPFLSTTHSTEVNQFRQEMLAKNAGWAAELSAGQATYSDWLSRHGTAGEQGLFNRLSAAVFSSAASLARRYEGDESPSLFVRAYIALHGGLIRAGFIIIACWRLWIIIIAFSFYRGWSSWRVHKAKDILGETGNGRLYYSGIRIGIDKVSETGAPSQHVRGLACLPEVPSTEAQDSELGRILARYSVNSATNMSLAATILACSDYPAYVAQQDEDGLLGEEFASARLPDNAAQILERVMELHRFYQQNSGQEVLDRHFEQLTREPAGSPSSGYAVELQAACHRVLTPQMRNTIGSIPAEEIATIVLAYEAGKCMAYAKEGGKWIRKSAFSELTARSVLHSVQDYGSDYSFESRANIRRALIYGSRYSALGPVTVPADLAPETRAARQWVELLMACPYEIERVANEVELHAVVIEVHARWMQLFFDGIMTRQAALIGGSYATSGNLFLMPASNVVRLARKSITLPMLRRLEQLIDLVTQDQKLRLATAGSDAALEERSYVPVHARVFEPFSESETKALMENYGLKQDEVRDWSSLRVVLNSFGWLGRRVGDHSVPESSIVYTVMRVAPGFTGANHLNLVGAPGMVPLRGTRLEERWGKSWQNHFPQVLFAWMAENREDYEKLMQGIRDEPVDETPTAAQILNVG